MIDVTREGSALIVTLNSPPVNAIGQAMRQALADAFADVARDPDLERVVLTGANRTFAAGADAREFDTDPEPPHLPDVITAMEACGKPCIAAIDGPALGGGYELALACAYRIASPRSRIGLPEVTLGVVPGAGGTQRLPRLIGVTKSVPLISEGRIVDGATALDLGMIDAVADDPLAAALALDTGLVDGVPSLSQRPSPEADADAIDAARARTGKRMQGQIAPQEAINLVVTASETEFSPGAALERKTFLELRKTDQARALRHIFFAERGAKIPRELAGATSVDVRRAIVVGGGTMGTGIAYALTAVGISTHIVETDAGGVERAEHALGRLFSAAVDRGLMTEQVAAQRRESMTVGVGLDDDASADLAIEAVVEDMDVKKEVLSSLERMLPSSAVLATNTSYLDVNVLGAALNDPTRLVGLHFFSPAHIMKLLEIVRAERTSDVALATAFNLAKRLRKIPVVAGVCDGFIGNRILARYREIADVLLIDGALPWDIDEVMVAFGYAMGPYMAQDLSGLDIAYANRQRLAATRDPNRRYVTISDRMVEEGRLGRKASVGWYRYPGGGGAVVDPLLEDLIVEEAYFAKITRRDFSPDEIRERLLAAMINEACAILDEGVASSAEAIDLVTVHGYGFPRWRGGLMHYATTIGFDTVLDQVESYAREDDVLWVPSAKLRQLAQDAASAKQEPTA